MPSITCSKIHKSYPSGFLGRAKKPALVDVSLSSAQHEIFGIIGPNGAGKSTLLKILMGFVRPDKGTASIGDNLAGTVASHKQLGFLPENPSLYPHLTAAEHLDFSCRLYGIPKAEARELIHKALQSVSLEHAANLIVKGYSKGMKQRLALAYAMMHNPEILILDEPMSGLDPLGRHLVIDIIQTAHQQGSSILFCSHILTDVERICDRIAVLHQGRLLAETTPQALISAQQGMPYAKTPSPLESFFLTTVRGEA